VFQSRPGKPQFQKDPWHFIKHDNNPSIHVSNDADHTRMRRTIAHAFSEKALKDQEPIMHTYTDMLIKRLGEAATTVGTTNIKQWYKWALFDMFGDLCFNQPFGCLEAGKSHPWIDLLTEAIGSFYFLGLARRVPGAQSLLMAMVPKKKMEQAEWHTKYSIDLADRRIAMKTDRADFMSAILKHNDTEKGLSLPEIHSTTGVFIPGGSDTVSTSLTGTTYLLLKHPDKLRTLVEEIRSSYKSVEEITVYSTSSLKYLTAVIYEGLRTYPPVATNLPREVPEGGAIVCGMYLPGGVSNPERRSS